MITTAWLFCWAWMIWSTSGLGWAWFVTAAWFLSGAWLVSTAWLFCGAWLVTSTWLLSWARFVATAWLLGWARFITTARLLSWARLITCTLSTEHHLVIGTIVQFLDSLTKVDVLFVFDLLIPDHFIDFLHLVVIGLDLSGNLLDSLVLFLIGLGSLEHIGDDGTVLRSASVRHCQLG